MADRRGADRAPSPARLGAAREPLRASRGGASPSSPSSGGSPGGRRTLTHHRSAPTLVGTGAAKIGSLQIEVLQTQFKRLDRDRDNVLSFEEISPFLRQGRRDATREELEALFEAADKNGDGRVDLGEFMDFVQSVGSGADPCARAETVAFTTGLGFDSPGPAAYRYRVSIEAHRPRPTSPVIGKGLGHEGIAIINDVPGPGSYRYDDRVQAHISGGMRATIGRGTGHKFLGVSTESPGPAAYKVEERLTAKWTRSPKASIGGAAGHGPRGTPWERSQFRRFDSNKDGVLDADEVSRLLRISYPAMEDAEVRSLFRAMDMDKDGKVSFGDLVAYVHTSEHLSSRRKLQEVFAEPSPGPGDYPLVQRDRVKGGAFGKARGH